MVKVTRTSRNKKRTSKATPSVSLPTKKNVPPSELHGFICCVFGRKNIGKSSLVANFHNCLVFMCERGRRNLRIHQVPQEGDPDLTWTVLREYVKLVIESDQFEVISFDTIDRAYRLCHEYVCQEVFGVTNPNLHSEPYIIWDSIRTEFEECLNEIRFSGKSIIFISHEKPKPLNSTAKGLIRADDEGDSPKPFRLEPSCTGQCWSVMQELCDYVFYYGFYDTERAITVRSPNEKAWTACGDSDETFRQPDGQPVNTFLVGNSAASAYEALQDAFHNKLWDVDYEPPREKKAVPRKKKSAKKKSV